MVKKSGRAPEPRREELTSQREGREYVQPSPWFFGSLGDYSVRMLRTGFSSIYFTVKKLVRIQRTDNLPKFLRKWIVQISHYSKLAKFLEGFLRDQLVGEWNDWLKSLFLKALLYFREIILILWKLNVYSIKIQTVVKHTNKKCK